MMYTVSGTDVPMDVVHEISVKRGMVMPAVCTVRDHHICMGAYRFDRELMLEAANTILMADNDGICTDEPFEHVGKDGNTYHKIYLEFAGDDYCYVMLAEESKALTNIKEHIYHD